MSNITSQLSIMEAEFAAASKDALVEVVRMAQKRGMKGNKGTWKEFLAVYDKKFGSSLSDPSKRQPDALLSFIKTFNEQDMKVFYKVIQCRSNPDAIVQFANTHPDGESPEMKLVRLTLGHPYYALDYSFPSHEEGWLVTNPIKGKKKNAEISMIAVDCEMVLCEDGTEAVAKICVVDRSQAAKLNEFVKPDKAVVDYRSEITGLTAKDLEGARSSLADVQKSMRRLLSHGTILVGHGLNNDLKALKLDHARVIDTSLIFKYGVEGSYKRPSLFNLCKSVLGYDLRKTGAPHNCLDDATAAMKLVLAKIQSGEDTTVLPIPSEPVPEVDLSKLLLHRVPRILPTEKLHKIISGDFTIQSKPKKKGLADYYSALAIFKNQQEADKAFESANGKLETDSYGRPQKLISYKLENGVSGELYIRKNALGSSVGQVPSRKRALESEDKNPSELKILKTEKLGGESQCTTEATSDDCKIHLKEIERLNKQLKEKENEISSLNKIIVALTRKQGL
ncbi:small RNA degrading nuclease 1-like [Impatiens glandulifera]|uniref:small RNA degrading nuclease 1-like n=1 Tax=Impatiens glandulifera TaxID=253017 RepID=UPI001FB172DD|nr:small RNA degrading nuclease 1-like [Impatiens glandulifera]